MTDFEPGRVEEAGPIIGWRTWIIELGVPVLRSVAMNHEWPQGDCHAVCMQGQGWSIGSPAAAPRINTNHVAPAEGCMCGLYARTTVEGCKQEYPYYPTYGYWAYSFNSGRKFMTMGAVLMWGDVARGKKVIKASRARVLCLTELLDPYAKNDTINDPSVIGEDDKARRTETIQSICMAYGIPMIPIGYVKSYAAEFGQLTSDKEDDK